MTNTITVPELYLTDNIRDAMKQTLDVQKIEAELKQRCEKFLLESDSSTMIPGSGQPIPVNLIRDVYMCLKNNGKEISLYDLVKGAELTLREPVLPPRDPELEARVQQLRIKEENEEYCRMTQNVDPTGKEKFTFQDEVKTMNRQLTSVINFLITVIAGFAFGYKVVEYSFGRSLPIQMMSGLVVGTIIFFVDLYFMLKYTPV